MRVSIGSDTLVAKMGGRTLKPILMGLLLVLLFSVLLVIVRTRYLPPAPPVPTEPTPTAPRERLGLHVTKGELAMWRERAQVGPYKSPGDVSENSPGDWARITEHSNAFMANPAAPLWAGPVANNSGGCVARNEDSSVQDMEQTPPVSGPSELRDAAFLAMVETSHAHARRVHEAIVAQEDVAGTDFGDRSRFCLGNIGGDENPVFNISNFVSKYIVAYDYLLIYERQSGVPLFTPTQRTALEDWFRAYGVWVQAAIDGKLNELFVDREGGDYRLTDVATNARSSPLYKDGPVAHTLALRYNNRVAASTRTLAQVGVFTDNASFKRSATSFVKEWLKFSYFPQGAPAEFGAKSDPGRPSQGWKYGCELAGSLVTIADVLARGGDTGVYEFTTTEGALGSQGAHHLGGPKSLETYITDLYRYMNHDYVRHVAGKASVDNAIIDSTDPLWGKNWINDVMMVHGNVYWRQDYIRRSYMRTQQGAPPYPADPSQSQGNPEGGDWGTYPGMLFMFGQPGNRVAPYPG